MGQVPLSGIALAITIVVALALGRAVAGRIGVRGWVGVLLLFGFGLVLSATLVPTESALAGQVSNGTCDTSRVGFAPLDQLTRVTFASLNVVLFVPLGLAVAFLPRTGPGIAIALLAIALPFLVEGIQLLVPVLGRGCETADLFDNSLGLFLGLGIGALLRGLQATVTSRTRD